MLVNKAPLLPYDIDANNDKENTIIKSNNPDQKTLG